MNKLTIKQEKFCNHYIETGNASEAYRFAYSCENMQSDTINRKAVELLDNGKITARVKELQSELKEKSDIQKEEAVNELTNIVRARISDIVSIKNNSVVVKSLDCLPDSIKSCIKSIKETNAGITVELYDKIASIDRLSRMLGWDEPERVEANLFHSHFDDWTNEQLEDYINGYINEQAKEHEQ